MTRIIKAIFEEIERISSKYQIFYYIRLAIFVLLIIGSILFLKKIFFEKRDNSTPSIELKPVDSYRDRYNNLRADIEVQQVESKKEFKRVTDSLKKVLKGRTDIQSVTTHASKSDTTFVDVPVYVDSSDSMYYFLKEDNYVSIYGELNPNTRTTSIQYKSFDTTTFIFYDKKRFLKSDIRTVNVSNKNPYNKIIAGNSIELKQQKVLGTFGPYIGYDVVNNKVGAGIAFTINILPIKTRK